jgi:prophage antirepressor-like protein
LRSVAIRVVTIDGEPWFVAKDVCDVLGYENSRDAVLTHTAPNQRNTVAIRDGNRGNPNKTIVSEGGLYALILGSKMPHAQAFKSWVTDEVLTAVRKDGMYVAGEEKVKIGELSEDELVTSAPTTS